MAICYIKTKWRESILQQESILVGWVPPTCWPLCRGKCPGCVCVQGVCVCAGGVSPGGCEPGGCPVVSVSRGCTPSDPEAHPSTLRPRGRHPLDPPPCGQKEWHAPVKTLASHNYSWLATMDKKRLTVKPKMCTHSFLPTLITAG